MTRCSHCSGEAPDGSRFCPACAAPLDPSSSPTRTSARRGGGGDRAAAGVSGDPGDDARFVPGTLVARRYRIVGLLGRGGMGEVYRADDLKLGQPVALKFLPAALEGDAERLQRLLNEVRVARQVSHPNVCRVYDISDVDGQHFLSMEYVDGEDLASLLTRIGRLPEDKATEIARQLCNGLAAAHQQGILHRDLKPANVMIDGRGRVRITDFGLAGLAESFSGTEVRSGTPAYMAPEQLAGREVTARSDLYALGLVLYELFTGRRAFDPDSGTDRRPPSSPSQHVPGLDPDVERLLQVCLEEDPALRPGSALAASAMLPGGDPLAAVLAAGETPSPEMVAAAGTERGLHPGAATAFFLAILGGLVLLAASHSSAFVASQARLPSSTGELVFQARRVVELLGAKAPAVDRAFGFEYDQGRLQALRESSGPTGDWAELDRVEPPPITFWYRQAATYMAPNDFRVSASDPRPGAPGDVEIRLDTRGRLIAFRAAPMPDDPVLAGGTENAGEGSSARPAADWTTPFELAGLDLATFRSVAPEHVPAVYCDTRAAWIGSFPGRPGIPLRVEAGSLAGRPVEFHVRFPWTDAPETAQAPGTGTEQALTLAMVAILLVGGAILARINVRLGRGDRRGALRLGLVLFLSNVGVSLFGGHHTPTPAEVDLFLGTVAWGLLVGGLAWMVYLALEPFARRHWPDILIGWSRLLSGRWGDPRVGRDILIGGTFGVVATLLTRLGYLLPVWLDGALKEPGHGEVGAFSEGALAGLSGLHHVIALGFEQVQFAISSTIVVPFMLILLRVVLRRPRPAIGGTFLVFAAIGSSLATNPAIDVPIAVISSGLMIFVLVRYGVLALAAHVVVTTVDLFTLPSLEPTAWYAGRSLPLLLAILAVFALAFRASLGRRPSADASGPAWRISPAR